MAALAFTPRRSAEELFRGGPSDAAIGHGDTIMQLAAVGTDRLVALLQVALEHRTDDGCAAATALGQNVPPDHRLAPRIFRRVGMAAIDHEARFETRLAQPALGVRRVTRTVVSALASTAQHNMAVRIARRLDNRSATVLVDAEETVRRTRGEQRIKRRLHAAIGAVLETDRHGETAGHFAMGLGFRGAGANRGPTDHIGQILRDNRIEELGRGRESEGGDLQQNPPGQTEARGEVAGIVHSRIVDQALPSDGGARFLEIDAHKNADRIFQFMPEGSQTARVIEGALRIMDRARTDDGQEARVATLQNGLSFGAAAHHGRKGNPAGRQFFLDHLRGDEAFELANPRVFKRTVGLSGRHEAGQGEPEIKPQSETRCNSRLAQRLCSRSAAG